ncbi:MAG: hypothetical protein COV79_05610 [Parcubacteria group bacterium CG11_big_fil_rev_8_21_14_0_20_41_14]|nr:MAG: hypothetical protein COV79_05610 [Parcubacteria group bacterium CG11_big_fil_rev_8_21_14_0_20_41_14]
MNEDGQVKLNSSDKLIASIADQIDNGGGNLKITGFKKDKKSRGRRRFNLRKKYRYIQIDEKFDDVKYLKSEKIIEITEELKDKYTLKKDGHKDENSN